MHNNQPIKRNVSIELSQDSSKLGIYFKDQNVIKIYDIDISKPNTQEAFEETFKNIGNKEYKEYMRHELCASKIEKMYFEERK